MKEPAPQLVVVPPEFSSDGNVGIEQDGNYLGVFTECCYADPQPVDGTGNWQCGFCETRLHVYAPGYPTIKDVTKSSSTAVQEWVATWINRNYHDVGIEISLP